MQWSNEQNGGFSTAPPDKLRRPVVEGKKWGPAAINVADQQRDPDSMLSWMERLIRRRRETPEIAFGDWSFVPVPKAPILAMRFDWGRRTVLVIHNLGRKAQKITFKLDNLQGSVSLIDLFGEGTFSLDGDGLATVEVGGYGYRWLRLQSSHDASLV
jgi:maltose alpha-D-glucosyltransferase/alpha-amylase